MIKFHEKAILLAAVAQNSENNCAVKTSQETSGTITSTLNSSAIVGVGTKFAYGLAPGDGLGELTVGAYIFTADGSAIIGRVESITDQTHATLTANAETAVAGAEFSTGLGPENYFAAFDMSYTTELPSTEYQYSGDELDRYSETVITDKYCTMQFATFLPRVGVIAGAVPEITDIQYPEMFEASGFAVVLDDGVVEFTNSIPSNVYLTMQVRRQSQDDASFQKTFTAFGARGQVDLDATIGFRGKLTWTFTGNFKSMLDLPAMEKSAVKDSLQKQYVSGTISSNSTLTSQLTPYDGVTTPVLAPGTKNICFDKLMVPNISGFSYTRYQTSCADGWSKGAIGNEITANIAEDKAGADYNPHDNIEKSHSLWLEFSTEGSKVQFEFLNMQLVGIPNSTVAEFSGQNLTFKNRGMTTIKFFASEAGTGTATITLKPKFGTADDSVDPADLETLLETMTDIPGSSSGGRSGTFSLTTTNGTYGWVAVLSSVVGGGLHFFDGVGYGGWSGAGVVGNNTGASPDPTTSTTTLEFEGHEWTFFRQDYVNANPTPANYTIS